MSKTRTRNRYNYPHKEVPPHIERQHRTSRKCKCGKVYSETRSQAKKLYKDIERAAQNPHRVYFYTCENGAWHWTRQALDY